MDTKKSPRNFSLGDFLFLEVQEAGLAALPERPYLFDS
jgi:hypothetical protein